MTAQELIRFLSELDPNTEIRLAVQPHYPVECIIWKAVAVSDDTGAQIVYLAEDEQNPLPGDARRALEWDCR